jgi:acetyltransferase-like isoleucine patch superfamily enzyme
VISVDDDMSYNELDITGAWDYGSLPANVRVGHDCWLERRDSFVRFRSQKNPGLVLGNRVRVYTWTTFNVEPAGYIEVGDDSILVGPVFMCTERILLGRNVTISYHVTIADSDFHPSDPDLRVRDAIASSPHGDRGQKPAIISEPVTIDDDVWVGIGAIVLKGVHIGAGARIHAGAIVTRDVPPGTILAGNPARPVNK